MNSHLDRILHFKGNPYEIGLAAGRALGAKLEYTLNHYIARREHASDMAKLHQGALPWLRNLPKRFQQELVTAYANVACPASGEIWYTFGEYPAASAGNWQRLDWPWAE